MLDMIKRAWRRQMMAGKHPTKITMTQEMLDELEIEAAQYMITRTGEENGYKEVFGMQVEVKDDMSKGVMFYIN